MSRRDGMAALVLASTSLGAGCAAMQRTIQAFEAERIRLNIDSDEYAWRALTAVTSSAASAAFWMTTVVLLKEMNS